MGYSPGISPELSGYNWGNWNNSFGGFDSAPPIAAGPDFSNVQPIGVQGSVMALPKIDALGGSGGGSGSGAGVGGADGSLDFGWNTPTIRAGLQGIQTLSNLYMGLQQNALARKAFTFQRDLSNTNLNNSIKSYNTQLGDKISSRAFVEGMSPEQANAYIASNKLDRSGFQDPNKQSAYGH